jgi:hypothetical protein
MLYYAPMRKNILFICGVVNQTSQLHQISQHLSEYNCYFTPFYVDGLLEVLRRRGMLETNGVGEKLASRSMAYMHAHNLPIDYRGESRDYDLVVTCSDLYVQRNIHGKKMILVQEGMTDPETLMYHLVKWFRLPRYLASTAATGLSYAYDYFCVASQGYREHFIAKGIDPSTIRVTGMPNYDNCRSACDNDFPYRGYVLAATSDMRETFKFENRRAFIEKCLRIADGRQLIFKLHPNENVARATDEIERWAPGAMVFSTGNTDHMIANCDVLITRYSTVVYVGIALGKEVYSDFDIEMLRRMAPIQNGGTSARTIAEICRRLVEGEDVPMTFGGEFAGGTDERRSDTINEAV